MLTIAETVIFSATWPKYWTPEEFGDFCAWLALNPEAGDVIPLSGGCRKVRWLVEGRGKRGGVRIIYFNRLADGTVWLMTMYSKNVRENISVKSLVRIRETLDGKTQRKGTGKVRGQPKSG
jgi:hypothetical protein